MEIDKDLLEDLMNDDTQYCCYCGTIKYRFSCCGEVHFETFREMDINQQQEIIMEKQK